MSIIRTIFIIIVLTVGALFFSADADNLVLHPIERMISKVEIIRRDPLYAIKLGDEQYRGQIEIEPTAGRNSSIWATLSGYLFGGTMRNEPRRRARRSSNAFKRVTMETKILENMIIKLGSLLALGFGEAGSEIIGHNLDDGNVMVDARIPGKKVEAIYGYCHIQDFTITTEVLQERTSVFVNQVAEIVHRIVDEHLGAANKNVGDAFLLVWRIGLYEPNLRSRIADLSVLSFIQVVAETSRNPKLAAFLQHPSLLARRGNFRVGLGFGLHLGWSIEGAIGSEFKIDASYLSSHVNMAIGLQNVSRQYGVMILMSEALVRACTSQFAYYFRPIDNVRLGGAKVPTRLFTVDLDSRTLALSPEIRARKDANRYRERQLREERKLDKLGSNFSVSEIFVTDKHIKSMRAPYELDFFQEFEKGYLNYEAGEWDVASCIFEVTSTMLPDLIDGPSCALLEYMAGLANQAPHSWDGFHELSHGPCSALTGVGPTSSKATTMPSLFFPGEANSVLYHRTPFTPGHRR